MPLPPPEKPEAVRARRNIILSFWAVILILGLPTWWFTTAIPRAALPIEHMLKWETERPQYPVEVRVAAPNLSCETLKDILSRTQSLLDDRKSYHAFRIQLHPVRFRSTPNQEGWSKYPIRDCPEVPPNEGSEVSALDVELREGDGFSFSLSATSSSARLSFPSSNAADVVPKLAESLTGIFTDEQSAVAYQYLMHGDTSTDLQTFIQTLPQDTISSIERHVARSFKPSPNYHLTFSLFTAGGAPSDWDIQSAAKRYIEPLVYSLSSSANISIATQVQMYSALSPSIQPFQTEAQDGWFLRQNDLTAFINTAEWPLSPSIGPGPTMNFILYVPAKDQLPLRIEGSEASSWLIPQWGGIFILNPPLKKSPDTHGESIVSHLDEQLLKPAFETFQTQLLSLLGVPATSSLPLSLRLRSFQRLSGLSLYLRTTSNLGSLARLAQRLSNIPIPHHVSELVEHASLSLSDFQNRRSLATARAAYDASEKAFFDKSMVGQVYFPDEHKVAVYLPLLGPIGVPLLVGLLREIKQMTLAR